MANLLPPPQAMAGPLRLAEKLFKKGMAMAMNQPCGEGPNAWTISLLQTVPQAPFNLPSHLLLVHSGDMQLWEDGRLDGTASRKPCATLKVSHDVGACLN